VIEVERVAHLQESGTVALSVEFYGELRARLGAFGYGHEYEWAQTVGPPADAITFFCEYGWVVVNSGMRNQVAARIWERVIAALSSGERVFTAFKHPGKAAAIQLVWDQREDFYAQYMQAEDKIAFLADLPWIGQITKWHLAKNFGVDCAKPDRHLVRLAQAEGTTPERLCQRLADATGDRIGTVDLILWRAANLGWL
jgi:hypothetical protein